VDEKKTEGFLAITRDHGHKYVPG